MNKKPLYNPFYFFKFKIGNNHTQPLHTPPTPDDDSLETIDLEEETEVSSIHSSQDIDNQPSF